MRKSVSSTTRSWLESAALHPVAPVADVVAALPAGVALPTALLALVADAGTRLKEDVES